MIKDLNIGGASLTPQVIGCGFASPSPNVLRIVRCHPAIAIQFKLAMAELYQQQQLAPAFDFAWQTDPTLPLAVAQCWLFDGERVIHVATIRNVGIPYPWNNVVESGAKEKP